MPHDIEKATSWLKERAPDDFSPGPKFNIAKAATDLARNRGLEIGSDEHIQLVDEHLHAYESDCSVARGDGPRIKLSPEELEIARICNLEPADYAREKHRKQQLEKTGAIGNYKAGY